MARKTRRKSRPKNHKKIEEKTAKSWPFVTWSESRKRWICDARTSKGGRRTFHTSEEAANACAVRCRTLRENEGLSAFDATELSNYGWTVQQAIRFTIEHLSTKTSSVEIGQAIESLIESKEASGRSKEYCRTLKINATKLRSYFQGRKICTITATEIQAFIASVKLAPATLNTIRRDCVTLWNHARKSGWVSSNIAELTDRITDIEKTPEIFTPNQVADLLAHSTNDILAFHAIGFFAGLRVKEIERLDWREVDLQRGFIHVSAKKSKTRSRRLVPILPNLAAWLTPVHKPRGPVIEPNFKRRHLATRNRAGFKPETPEQLKKNIKLTPWPDNGMRHSFVSYRLADTNDAAKTAFESGHSQTILFRNYRELVRPEEARAYFSIVPTDKILPLQETRAA